MTLPSEARYRVLVVDDDPSVLATYRRLLRRAGYTAVTEDDPHKVLSGEAGGQERWLRSGCRSAPCV